MKKLLFVAVFAGIAGMGFQCSAQKVSSSKVPAAAKAAFAKTYPMVNHIKWETENGDFEGNWKVKGKDHSALFTPDGQFAGSETDINPSQLPQAARSYVAKYGKDNIKEASLNKDAHGETTYEADLKGETYIFDQAGNFVKKGESEEGGSKGEGHEKGEEHKGH